MQVEKLYYEKMDFEIKTEGDMNRMFVPPLLFIPLVQGAIKAMQEKGSYFSQCLSFKSGEHFILFECDHINRNQLLSPGFKKIKRRLDTLYPGKYTLDVKGDESRGGIPIVSLYIKYL